jgi:hypothetical protein
MAFNFLSQSGTFLLSLPSSSSLPVESRPVSPSTYIVSCTVPYFGRSSKLRRCAFAAFCVARTSTCTISSQYNSHAVSTQEVLTSAFFWACLAMAPWVSRINERMLRGIASKYNLSSLKPY